MKRKTAVLLIILALCLTACGSPKAAQTMAPTAAPTEAPSAEPTAAPADTPAPTAAPTDTPEPTPEPTPAGPTPTPVAAGTYTYKGPKGTWKLQLRDDDIFVLTDPDGTPHSGEGWSTDTDGTVLCGPTDIYFEEFAFGGGCSRWIISGKSCTPVMP